MKTDAGIRTKESELFRAKAKLVAAKKPKISAMAAKYTFQIIPEPIKTIWSQIFISVLGKLRSPIPIERSP